MLPGLRRARALARVRMRRRHHLVLGLGLIAVSSFNLVTTLHRSAADPGAAVQIGAALTASRANPGVPATGLAVSAVRVIAQGCDATLYGSGVILDGARVLTARHVVDGATRVMVETEDGKRYTAKSMSVDGGGRDAAVLTMSGLAAAGAPLRFDEPERGDPVAVAGHPEGGLLHTDYTTVMTYTSQAPLATAGTRVMILDSGFAEGMSGGPVSDGAGAVVGIAVGIETNTKIGIATPVSGLGALVAGNGTALAPTRC